MSITIPEPTAANPYDGDSYNSGYLDGELDAISQLPSVTAHERASMADAYDLLWAQGYIDGYLNQIQVAHALAHKDQVTR